MDDSVGWGESTQQVVPATRETISSGLSRPEPGIGRNCQKTDVGGIDRENSGACTSRQLVWKTGKKVATRADDFN